MTSERDWFVHVALPGQSEYVVAGRFRVSGTSGDAPLGEFVYGRSYLSRSDAVEFDPVQLRLTEGVRKTVGFHGLFGAIRDTIPASYGRFIVGSSAESVLDTEDHLVRGADEFAGALSFATGLEPPRPKRCFHSIEDLARLRESVDAKLAREDGRENTHRAREPLIESNHKAIVEDDRSLWVAKFPRDNPMWNQARVRHATLQLARDCGLDAILSRLERIDGEDILLMQRIDREWVGGGYSCRRMISGLTLLGTDDTPPAKDDWFYLSLADEVRRASSHPREDLRELFGRMCFSSAMLNLNDDLRRPIMFGKGTGWRLAPASSPVPMPLADGARGDSAMICGPCGRSPSRESIVGRAGRFLLDRAAAEAIFDRISTTVQSSWYTVMRRCGVSPQDCEVVARSIVGGGDCD